MTQVAGNSLRCVARKSLDTVAVEGSSKEYGVVMTGAIGVTGAYIGSPEPDH